MSSLYFSSLKGKGGTWSGSRMANPTLQVGCWGSQCETKRILSTLRNQSHVSVHRCSYRKGKGKMTSLVVVGQSGPLCLEVGFTHVTSARGEGFDRNHQHHQTLVAVNTSITAKTVTRPVPLKGWLCSHWPAWVGGLLRRWTFTRNTDNQLCNSRVHIFLLKCTPVIRLSLLSSSGRKAVHREDMQVGGSCHFISW